LATIHIPQEFLLLSSLSFNFFHNSIPALATMLFKPALLFSIAATVSAAVVKRQSGNGALCYEGVHSLEFNDQDGAEALVRKASVFSYFDLV
jgi:hypothetical protein